jgi:hypothetical protein
MSKIKPICGILVYVQMAWGRGPKVPAGKYDNDVEAYVPGDFIGYQVVSRYESSNTAFIHGLLFDRKEDARRHAGKRRRKLRRDFVKAGLPLADQ